MKTYTMWNDSKLQQKQPGADDMERTARLLQQVFKAASTLTPPMIAEALRLDVRNYARECDEELS
jgi:hypothetical protein